MKPRRSPRAWSWTVRCKRTVIALCLITGLGGDGGATAAAPEPPARPSVVFILLDTARSDRFGAWGNPRATTPHLDRLAASGIQFVRHYANSHATRPSMPQIMSGRYYHRSILRNFRALKHPREYYFIEPDPTAVLLPELLRDGGYHLLGVSTHPWVVADSSFGRPFDRLDFLPVESRRGHEDAGPAIDRALALWRNRPRDRPVFLYVHLLDLHTPRWLPQGVLRFADHDVRWQDRFLPGFEPRFGAERRYWNHSDARDFTDSDRMVYMAAYDTLLAYTDREVGRLIAALRAEDPQLASVLVVVAADHGEELAEEGRIKHSDSLAESVQHVPFILAGAGIPGGQRFEAFSENVDVMPTVAHLLGLDGTVEPSTFDGRSLVERGGMACRSCGRRVVYYTWADYDAVRTPRWLLRREPEGSPRSACRERREILWRLQGRTRKRVQLSGRHAGVADRLRRKIEQHLDRRAAAFRAGPRRAPDRAFEVPAAFWRLPAGTALDCWSSARSVDPRALTGPGWWYVRESFFVSEGGSAASVRATVDVPEGAYEIAVGIVPLRSLWWLPGFGGWLRASFHADAAEAFVPLGTVRAAARQLTVVIPAELTAGQRVLSLRLTPQGAAGRASEKSHGVDRDHRERLRALGYID